MSDRHYLHPLTPAQQEFAAENHELVFQYLVSTGCRKKNFTAK